MDINKFFQSKIFLRTSWVIAGLIVILFVFKAGMFVGMKKADFSYRWSDSYHRNFGGPQEGFFGDFGDKNFIEANGSFGQVIKIDSSNLVVKGRNDIEKIIVVTAETAIKRLQETISAGDIKVDDYLVVIGEPNESGQIEAKFIRIMPPPPPIARPNR